VISLIVFAVMRPLGQQHPRYCIRITVRFSRRLLEDLSSYMLAAKMREIDISLSFSRPRVSNDNAYAESLFRTMYRQSRGAVNITRATPCAAFAAWMPCGAGLLALWSGTTASIATAVSNT
jgi:transposase InsO family protein